MTLRITAQKTIQKISIGVASLTFLTAIACASVEASKSINSDHSDSLVGSSVVAQALSAKQSEAKKLMDLGNVQFDKENNEAAIKSYQQALAIYRQIGDLKGESEACLSLGYTYEQLVSYLKAAEFFQIVIKLGRATKNASIEAQGLNGLANIDLDQEKFDSAANYYSMAVSLASKAEDRPTELIILANLAQVYKLQKNTALAIPTYQKVIETARTLKDINYEVGATSYIADLYFEKGEHAKAIETYQGLVAIARKHKFPNVEIKALVRLSNVYWSLGDYDKSFNACMNAIAIARSEKDLITEAGLLSDIGYSYLSLGDNEKALSFYEQSLVVFRKEKDMEQTVKVQEVINEIRRLIGKPSQPTISSIST